MMQSTQHARPDLGHNLAAQLAAVAETRGDATAIVYPDYGADGVISYARLVEMIAEAAGRLVALGLEPGDRVLLCLDNQPELIVLAFACASAGLTVAIVNNRLKQGELELLLDDCRARCVVTNPVYTDVWGPVLERVEYAIVVQRGRAPSPATRAAWWELFAPAAAKAPCVAVREVEPAFVFYTSGTTAVPKGVIITHAHARWAAAQNIAQLAVTEADVTLLTAPLYHVLAFSYQMLTTLFSGGLIVLRKTFNPARFWDDALQHRCTWTAVVPYAFHALAAFPTPASHFFSFWGFPCKYLPMETRFGVASVGWWGMTELFALGSVSRRDDASAPDYSVGSVTPDYGYRLVDTRDDAGPFAAERNGELQIQGEPGKTMFLGYLDKLEETAQAFTPDGWFVTGDRFFEDARRVLFFDERTKDIIRVGGENVSAAEVELVVRASGVVQDVAVVGGPHRMLGEVPVVCAILNPDGACDRERAVAEILRTARERLAEFKQPQAVKIFEEFPRAALGKIAKNRLRELIASEAAEVERKRTS